MLLLTLQGLITLVVVPQVHALIQIGVIATLPPISKDLIATSLYQQT